LFLGSGNATLPSKSLSISTGPGILNASDLEYSKPSCTCRHLEDHHAFNFLELAEDACGSRVHEHVEELEARSSEARVFDVETATLLFRANQLDVRVATVLQCLIKHRGSKEGPYAERLGEDGALDGESLRVYNARVLLGAGPIMLCSA
jgi:hypothetical protein